MNKRNKIAAIFGASILALGVAGIALATDLHAQQAGTTLGSYYDAEACAAWPADAPEIGAGQIGVHFVLTSPESTTGNLSATFSNPASSVGPVANFDSPANVLHFYVVITGDANTVIESASTDTNGDLLNVSHACPGAQVTEAPSFEQSQADTTDAPSFEQSQADLTECPCDTTPGLANTSHPSDGAWLLVVALGVLLASVVVLTPARAKGRR